jgi:phospholipase/carboxylesterase
MQDLHLFENTVYAGADLKKSNRAMIFVHGRGDASDKMLLLSNEIVNDAGMALIFPKATNNTWYPKSFMAPTLENQPWLDSALKNMSKVVTHIKSFGIQEDNIFLFGFSQGGCLALEYACRNATKYAGIMILSGGLIGPEIDTSNYSGDFAGTEIFIGCSDTDFHIPLKRLKESETVVTELGARVELRIYPGMGHTINENELQKVRSMIQK